MNVNVSLTYKIGKSLFDNLIDRKCNIRLVENLMSNRIPIALVYNEHCYLANLMYILICRVLSSNEVLSTDEESSGSEGDSDDELGRNLESLLSSKKTALDLTHEQEELERQELRRLLIEDQPVSD